MRPESTPTSVTIPSAADEQPAVGVDSQASAPAGFVTRAEMDEAILVAQVRFLALLSRNRMLG